MKFYIIVEERGKYFFKGFDSIVKARSRAISEMKKNPHAKTYNFINVYTENRDLNPKAVPIGRVFKSWGEDYYPDGVWGYLQFFNGQFKVGVHPKQCFINGKLGKTIRPMYEIRGYYKAFESMHKKNTPRRA